MIWTCDEDWVNKALSLELKAEDHAVVLSQWSGKPLYKLCRPLPPPVMVARFTVFLASRAGHVDPLDGWHLLLIKADYVENNPGPTTT